MYKKLIKLGYSLMSSRQLMLRSEKVGVYHNLLIAEILLKRFPDDDEWDAVCEDFHARNDSEVEELPALAV